VNSLILFSPKTRRTPQRISKKPRNATALIITPLWNMLSKFAAFVAVKITATRIMNPVKETNPPRAIFNRLLVEKVDKASNRF
jgi:hypothetical protein